MDQNSRRARPCRVRFAPALYLVFAGCSGVRPSPDDVGVDSSKVTNYSGPIVGLAGKCLDASAGGADGTKVDLRACNGGAAQHWTLTKGEILGPGGKCLDATGGARADGTLVELWDCHGSAGQQWSYGATTKEIVGIGGKCLNVKGNLSTDGTPAILWDCVGTANEQWRLTAPAASVSPTSLSFGSATVGTTSASQAVTVKNTGTAALSLGTPTLSGDFALGGTGTCEVGTSLAAGASCTLNVVFKPSTAGARTGTLDVVDAAANSPQPVALSGSAVDTSGGGGGGGPSSGGYHVSGNKILDTNGGVHIFKGVNRPSLDWDAAGDHFSLADFKLMQGWGVNLVRIAVNQDFWLSTSSHYVPGYKATLANVIGWAEQAGIDVLIDLHWSDRGNLDCNSPAQGSLAKCPGMQRMADVNSITFWEQFAAVYKNDPHVFFDLYNEPHEISWDVWLKGGDSGEGYTAVGMQQLYNSVRGTGATNLVFIGGNSWANDLSEVPSYRVQGNNIVYANHEYYPDVKESGFDKRFGNLSATDAVAVTEFGYLDSACSTTFHREIFDYVKSKNISWTAWVWYVTGNGNTSANCKFGSLINDWSGTPLATGLVVKAAMQ